VAGPINPCGRRSGLAADGLYSVTARSLFENLLRVRASARTIFVCMLIPITTGSQFQNIVITKSIREGTYGRKSKYGVLTLYFSNTKLRDRIIAAIEGLRKGVPS
jgi:hypothetical protein